MTTPKAQYIRTEPPALLTEPLTVTLDASALQAFNNYRQARHAWLSCTGDLAERLRLREKFEGEAVEVAGFILARAQIDLGEPEEWAPAES